MSKPVIAFVVSYFPIAPGGAELQSYLIAKSLRNELDIHFISMSNRHEKSGKIEQDGFTIWFIPKRPIARRLFCHDEFLNYYKIKKIFNQIKPVYVYQRCIGYNTWICGNLKKRLNYRFILHVANDNDLSPALSTGIRYIVFKIEKILSRKGASLADKIFVQNKFQAKSCIDFLHRNDYEIVYNFSHVLDYPIIKNTKPLHVIWVANIKPIKNPSLYLDIVKYFSNNPNVDFTMAGIPGSNEIMEEIYQIEKNTKNFKYVGYISNDDVNNSLERSHLLINTSFYEGFSNTFVQAWFRKCPVLSYRVNPDNLISEHSLGFCANGDKNLMIAFLNDYIFNYRKREELENKSLLFAVNNLSDKVILPKIKTGIIGYEK